MSTVSTSPDLEIVFVWPRARASLSLFVLIAPHYICKRLESVCQAHTSALLRPEEGERERERGERERA
eukprot:15097951-Heterocapsa_arctica.AAC.1